MPSNHYLARRVEIDGGYHLILSCGLTSRNHRGIIQADNRCHRANAKWYRMLHVLTALANQVNRISEAQGTTTYQGRILTEAVTGHNPRVKTTLLKPQTPDGNRAGQYGRLGYAGLRQLSLGVMLNQ